MMVRNLRRWVWLSAIGAIVFVVLRSETPSDTALAAALCCGLIGVWLLSRRFQRVRVHDWRDAEEATARWLRKAGCRQVVLSGGSADGGIDVTTANLAVQVKHTAKRVGRPTVQQMVGAALTIDRQPAVFSTSGFSAPAIEYAADHDVALFELDLHGNAHPLNHPARQATRR